MKYLLYAFALLITCSSLCYAQDDKPQYVLVIHGGAGSIIKGKLSAEDEALYKKGLQKALAAGEKVLKNDGDAIDAVQAAIMVLENDSMFNAGKGAVFADNGANEMDASIMNGKDLEAGAVAGITNIKNPITAARAVMDRSEHVLLAREGAEEFAEKNGCEVVEPSYFHTQRSRATYERVKAKKEGKSYLEQPGNYDEKYGTVGAVALDKNGNLAAGTSTGGMTNKKFGRIGDSPLIGSGTYADNNGCAVSCTGWGEYFIRLGMAKAISDRVELKSNSLEEAVNVMIHEKLNDMGASGGVIVVDKDGNIAITFNTQGMHRAWLKSTGETGVEIYE